MDETAHASPAPNAEAEDADQTDAGNTGPQETDAGESGTGQTGARPTMAQQLTGLYADGRLWLDSELGFQKSRVNYTVRAAKLGAIAVCIGLFSLLCAFITLLLGIFMTVIYYFGPLVALLTVPLAWALLGWLALRYAGSRLRDTKAMIAETGGITGRKREDADTNEVASDQNG